MSGYQAQLGEFERQHRSIDVRQSPVRDRVDHALIGSALARVRWELDTLQSWRRQPSFYVDQSIGVLFDRLVVPSPFDDERSRAIIGTLEMVRRNLEQGRQNLTGHAVAEFAEVTVHELRNVDNELHEVVKALAPVMPHGFRDRLLAAYADAAAALIEFREWLAQPKERFQQWVPVGEKELVRFLRTVALMPFTPDTLVDLAKLEYARATTLSVIEGTRPGGRVSTVFSDVDAQVRREAEDEATIRRFYVERGILSQPETLGRYLTAPIPSYLAPISWLGVTDDLTSDGRLSENGISYVPDPSSELPYFYAANACDPRLGVIHEGAHYQQLALSWRHPDPIRRHYYDSGPNEGIAFYNEELMLQAGLFDDSATSRALIYSFMRLRALRVEVDVRLALGDIGLDEARDYLATNAPMDLATAAEEAASFAASPGQGLSYQAGKTQIQSLFAEVVMECGRSFDLQDFHDYLWLNGNVPISLLRVEYLEAISANATKRVRGSAQYPVA